MSKQIILTNNEYTNLCRLAGFAFYMKANLLNDKSEKFSEEEKQEYIEFIEDKEECLDPDTIFDIEQEMTDFDF